MGETGAHLTHPASTHPASASAASICVRFLRHVDGWIRGFYGDGKGFAGERIGESCEGFCRVDCAGVGACVAAPSLMGGDLIGRDAIGTHYEIVGEIVEA